MAHWKCKLEKFFCWFLALCVIVLVATLYSSDDSPVEQSSCSSASQHAKHSSVSSRPARKVKDPNVVNFAKLEDNPYKKGKEWRKFFKALEHYKRFHQKKLQQLKYSPDGKGVRTLTWACSQERCSGIGDQMFRLEYFFLLAMMSDRLFTIYWDEKLQETSQHLIPNEIDWAYFNRSKGMCDDMQQCSHHVFDGGGKTSLWGFGWNTKEFSHFGSVLFSSEPQITVTGQVMADIMFIGNSTTEQGEQIVRGLEKLGVRQILWEKTNDTVYTDHRPLWYTMLHKLGVHHVMEIPEISNGRMQPTNAWLYLGHTIFTYLFGFSHTLLSKVQSYQESLGLYNTDYLVVHVRTGFLGQKDRELWARRYLSERWKIFSSSEDWKCIIQHGINLRDKALGRNASIYISTDSNLVKDLVVKDFGSERVKFGNISLVHSNVGCGALSSKVNNRIATWLDFFMLAEAKVIVHSESSFSINAAFLKPIPHSFHSWVMYDNDKGCLASYISGSTTCIC